ncbi:MAG: hypothetical protein IKW88_06005 [Clostridiales bacterium]|nr:hypothetical protein [Clostridiales bacterium]
MKPTTNLYYSQFQKSLFNIPYYSYALIELLSCISLIALGFEDSKYRSGNITYESIQQTIDALPEGIAVYGNDGTVRLSNLKINEVCRSVTGKVLTDANKFWDYVKKEGKEQGGKYLMRTPSDKMWLLEKDDMTVNDVQYFQIIATDVTERYAIIEELEKKNEHLQDIRNRMKEVSDFSGDMFIAQEEADARAALHNQLGQVLLMGRHYINHQETTDPKIVYAATMQMNRFLLGEAVEPYKGEEDVLSQAVSMANSIGVRVDIKGGEPKSDDAKKILSQAITECAANTVKHAEGDKVTVDIIPNENETVITLTNNGKPPKAGITESGGLLSLHRNIEAMGGIMELESVPEFRLTIRIH